VTASSGRKKRAATYRSPVSATVCVTDEGKIGAILRKHLGANAPISPHAVRRITNILTVRHPREQPFFIAKESEEPHTARFRKALRELKSALPAEIEGNAVWTALLQGMNSPSGVNPQIRVDHLRWLSTAVDLVEIGLGPPPRAGDRRSGWHATARVFASLIELGYQSVNQTPLPRTHVASPLVLAVRDLFAEMGVNVALDAIAKGLTAKSQSKINQTWHCATVTKKCLTDRFPA
jgi:hypothetical protein